jgi:hypothetical protein
MYRLMSLTTRGRGAALGAALVILATGCADIEAIRFSSPHYPGAHTAPFSSRDAESLRTPTDFVTIHVPDGFNVTVHASNRQSKVIAVGVLVPVVPWPPGILRLVRPLPAPPPLQIWLTVGPPAGADWLRGGPPAGAEFDLTRVLVIEPDGTSRPLSSVEGKLCDERKHADCNVTSNLPSLAVARLSIERSVVLVLSFPVEASPERSFVLRVDGLASRGVPITPLDIRFEPATAWVMFWGM